MRKKALMTVITLALILGCIIMIHLIHHIQHRESPTPPNPSKTTHTNQFDVVMYCKEIKQTGDVVVLHNFTLSGNVYTDENGDERIRLVPFSLGDLQLNTKDDSLLAPYIAFGELCDHLYNAPCFLFVNKDAKTDSMDLHLGKNYDFCTIIVDDRCFVGSIDPDFDAIAILKQYPPCGWSTDTISPDPNKIDIEMYAAEIYKDGSVMDTGEIIIQGTRVPDESGSDYLQLSNLQIMDLDLKLSSDPLLISSSDLDAEYEKVAAYVFYRGDATYLTIHLSKDRTWCLIELGSRHFVASTRQNFDPATILDRFPDFTK